MRMTSQRLSKTQIILMGPTEGALALCSFTGDPVETWTSRNDRGAVNWPKEFLPMNKEFHDGLRREIRVLSYGYLDLACQKSPVLVLLT